MYKNILFWVCLLSITLPAPPAFALNCTLTTPELAQMEVRLARLAGPDDRRIDLSVHIADENGERAAGFQSICPEVAEHTAIFFLFRRSHVPSFHMTNVHMPLDIAFVDASGMILDIQTMSPYVLGKQNQQRLWSPPAPVRAALEVKAGLFAQLGVTPGEWSFTLVE